MTPGAEETAHRNRGQVPTLIDGALGRLEVGVTSAPLDGERRVTTHGHPGQARVSKVVELDRRAHLVVGEGILSGAPSGAQVFLSEELRAILVGQQSE
jgi:hypothetical protein